MRPRSDENPFPRPIYPEQDHDASKQRTARRQKWLRPMPSPMDRTHHEPLEGHGMKPTTTPLDVLLGENARTLFQEGVRAAVRVYREDLAEGGQLAAKAALVHALREETSHDTVLCMLAEAIHQLAQKDAR